MPPTRVTRPFPVLALFTIYTTTPADLPKMTNELGEEEHHSDADLEASKVLFFSATEEPLSVERRARLMGTVMGMADFARMLSPGGAPSVRAVHSSKQRMIWSEPEPGYLIHATIDLPSTSRHSRAASTTTTNSTSSAAAAPLSTLEDTFLLESISASYHQYRLHYGSFASTMAAQGREGLRQSLEGYWKTWLSKWSVESGGSSSFPRVLKGFQQSPYINSKSSPELNPLLLQFSASNPSALPILLHGPSILHLPPLTPPAPPSATSSPSPDSDLTKENGVKTIRVPSPPLNEADLLALVEYLGSCTKSPTIISVKPPALKESKKSKLPPTRTESDAESKFNTDSSKWSSYYTLGMGSYLTVPTLPMMPSVPMPSMPSMPAIPSMPSMSMPSMPNMPNLPSMSSFPSIGSMSPKTGSPLAAAVAADGTVKKRDSSSWGLRSVSWGLGKRSSSPSLSGSSTPIPPVPPLPLDGAATATTTNDLPTHTSSGTVESAAAASAEASVSEDVPAIPSFEPAAEIAPDLDSLAEAIAAETIVEPAPPIMEDIDSSLLESQAPSPEREKEEETSGEEEDEEDHRGLEKRVIRLFCGDDTNMEVRMFERGPLTLALATLPLVDEDQEAWLSSRAARLLEAVENVLDANLPTQIAYPHRHVVRNGLLMSVQNWPEKEQQWSGKADPEDNEASVALYECLRGLHSSPTTLESFTRVSSSQWVISRRSEDMTSLPTSAMSLTDVFVILPAKVGKEGSLIDAAEELRKFDRAYQKV